jgi:hypothetical protein
MRKIYLIIGALTLVAVSIVAYCAYDQYCEARIKRTVRKQIEQSPIYAQVKHIADSLSDRSGNSTKIVVDFHGINAASIGIKESRWRHKHVSDEYRYRYHFTNYALVVFDEHTGKILQVSKM